MFRLLLRRSFAAVPARSDNFYAVLGLRETFDVQETRLAERFKALQQQWHPDRFGRSSEEERSRAANMSALINEAYSTLREPATRAKHLLQIRGKEEHPQLDPKFLAWVVETREAILEASSNTQRIGRLRREIDEATSKCLAHLAAAFKATNLNQAAAHAAELQYLRRIDSAVADTEERQAES